MKTRTAPTDESAAITQNGPTTEVEETGGQASYIPEESELWIFDGIDAGATPYEISLPHPRTGGLSTFAIAPKEGKTVIGEVRVFKSSTPGSFLTVLEKTRKASEAAEDEDSNTREALISKQDLRVVTEIDPAFLLLPLLAPKNTSRSEDGGRRGVFVTFEDWMDRWKERSPHVRYIVDEGYRFETAPGSTASTSMAATLEAALGRCCDTVTAGDETMYRYSEEKVFKLVLEKAQRMVAAGLPASLEDAAERAVDTSGFSAAKPIELDAEESVGTPGPGESDDSQISKASSVFSQDEAAPSSSSSKPAAPAPTSPNLELMRLRMAVGFILSNYVPPPISKQVLARLDEDLKSGIDFTPLRRHLEEAKSRRAALIATRDIASSKRRMHAEDDERAEERAEKKRKKEEEEQKRKSESVAIKALRKVDTRGMQKLSSFFTAKPKPKPK